MPKVLLIQDNPEYAELVKKRLSVKELTVFEVVSASCLKEAFKILDADQIDLALLELSLPDGEGLHVYQELQHRAPKIPIVILTALNDEILALQAVRAGAQDYLLKGEVEGKLLPRVICYAIERHRMRTHLLNMSLTDELTGLYNRRGFLLLAEQQLKLAKRNKKDLLLIMGDLDGFKEVNDRCGHLQGDAALGRVTKVLMDSFRKSDILARIGGDEFAIVAIDAGLEHSEYLTSRVHQKLEESQKGKDLPYSLSISLGFAAYDPEKIVFLEQLMDQADENLYKNKSEKKQKGSITSKDRSSKKS